MKSSLTTVALIALCAWLGWVAFELAGKPLPSIEGRTAKSNVAPAQDRKMSEQIRTPISFPPLEALNDIVARPLFNLSRRPIEVEKATPEQKPTELNIMLSGIVIGREGQIAHLRSATDKQTRALSVGDKIDNWEIQSIFPDRVVLRSGGRLETLFMQKPGASKATSGANSPSQRASDRSKRNIRRRLRRTRRGDSP